MRAPTFIVHESSGIDYMPPQQLAVELSKTHQTIIVGQPRRWWQPWQRDLCESAMYRTTGLCKYRPYQLPRRFPFAGLSDPINARIWKQVLKRFCRGTDSYLLLDRPTQHDRIGLLGERAVAYYAHCDYTVDIVGHTDPRLEACEREMLRKADVAFAASPILADRFSTYAKRVVHLSCFYNSDLFDGTRSYPEPSTMAAITAPRILFCGYISGRVDFLGLLRTVRERPAWNFVFLGGVSSALRDELVATGRPADLFDRLRAERNVHWLGRVPLQDVPPFMAASDVGLVPYCLSNFTMTSSPQKAFEYLAMGKPVVTTAVPETATVCEDIIITEETGSYASAIEKSLSHARDPGLQMKRRAGVQKHSVAARAALVVQELLCSART